MAQANDPRAGATPSSTHKRGAHASRSPLRLYLLIENPPLREHLRIVLANQGYEFRLSAEANRLDLQGFQPDVFVVEINSPNHNALQLVLLLKARFSGVPVLAVAPLDQLEWISEGVRSGVDEFVFLPLRPVELEARLQLMQIRSASVATTRPLIERRQSRHRPHTGEGECNPVRTSFLIDDRTKTVIVENRAVSLSPSEYLLLKLLASDPNRVFSTREIIACVWPGSQTASSADVQRFIYLLRRRIERDAHNPRWIRTVRGFGYLLDPIGG